MARDILEIGVLYSIFKEEPDVNLFERYMSQLKSYYFDYGWNASSSDPNNRIESTRNHEYWLLTLTFFLSKNIPVSPQKYEILGANLLHLLAEGRLDDFHMEVERILHPTEMAEEIMEIVYIKRAVELERALEEGRYGQVRVWHFLCGINHCLPHIETILFLFLQIHAQDGPQRKSGLWRYFVDKLTKSTRLQIAETMEVAYEKLSSAGIMDRLKFNTPQELEAFAREVDS